MINQFLSFDKLIGTTLIKIMYYVGLVGIALYAVIAFLGGLGLMTQNFAAGLGTILVAIIGAAVGLLFWRFMCEIYMLFFRISDDLRDIKNMKSGSPAADQDSFT